jgi:lipopolysaccharide export system protein LptC
MSRSGSLFPLILVLALALLSFWLQAVVDLPASQRPDNARHNPDTIVDNATLRSLDQQGQLQYRLQATRIAHFPDHDTNEITNPLLTYFRVGAPDVRISAARAVVDQGGDVVRLSGGVHVTRDPLPNRPAMEGVTETLKVMPDAGTATTDDPVLITQGDSRLSGIGMSFDNNLRTLELHAQVRGTYNSVPRQ